MTRTMTVAVEVHQGQAVIHLPTDIPDGPLHLTITLPDPAHAPSADWLADLQPTSLGAWPADTTFNREDLYDDGR